MEPPARRPESPELEVFVDQMAIAFTVEVTPSQRPDIEIPGAINRYMFRHPNEEIVSISVSPVPNRDGGINDQYVVTLWLRLI